MEAVGQAVHACRVNCLIITIIIQRQMLFNLLIIYDTQLHRLQECHPMDINLLATSPTTSGVFIIHRHQVGMIGLL
jgi:hypothetical protein